jgi:hypothetical protein
MLYSDKDDNVTPEYEGRIAVDEVAMAWEEFPELYCIHGSYRGIECLECNPDPVVPYFHRNRDFGDETAYGE